MHELSLQEHESRLHEMFGSQQKAGFALMEKKVTFRASEEKYLWHLKFSHRGNCVASSVKATQPSLTLRI
jgi:hypothetical protein